MMANPYWCRHYRALAEFDTCKIDVRYEAVKTVFKGQRRFGWPCIDPELKGQCELHEHFTQAEIDATNVRVTESLEAFARFVARKTDACPHCGRRVARLQQMGRSVYAVPCGCRLMQGRVPDAWKQPR